MSIYYCWLCDTTKDRDVDGCQEVEGNSVCQDCYDKCIDGLLTNHGIPDADIDTIEEAKNICGVAEILKKDGLHILTCNQTKKDCIDPRFMKYSTCRQCAVFKNNKYISDMEVKG